VKILILYAALILTVTAIPIPERIHLHGFPYDKIIHFGMFFLLAILARRVLRLRDALLVVIGIAFWSELQQLFVPLRSVELPDLCANLIGGLFPLLLRG